MHSAITDAKAYIEARIRQDISQRELAASACVSAAYLRELFAKEAGVPLGRYITGRRIANAAFDALYTDKSLMEIALEYGYLAYDTFTRAFKRVTGCTPVAFRNARPAMVRHALGGGLYGVDMSASKENDGMMHSDQNDTSVILYDVPRVRYGAFGGVTPYPICLKACANYMGDDIDYADAITGCGAAFRLTWNTACWDESNVDVCHTYQEKEPIKVYTQGVTALGRAYRALERHGDADREAIQAFIVECLRKGVPVIAMGIVGPPEAGLVTGFRDSGETLLGWSVFQEFIPNVKTDPCGYYITDTWWQNGVDTLIAMGDKVCPSIDAHSVVKRAVEVMRPRADGSYQKGLAACDAWKADMLQDANFPDPDAGAKLLTPDGRETNAIEALGLRLSCQNDAADCVADGRLNAMRYFRRHQADHALFAPIADAFEASSQCAQSMYKALGGFERDERQMRALSVKETRTEIVRWIDAIKASDSRAYEMLLKI